MISTSAMSARFGTAALVGVSLLAACSDRVDEPASRAGSQTAGVKPVLGQSGFTFGQTVEQFKAACLATRSSPKLDFPNAAEARCDGDAPDQAGDLIRTVHGAHASFVEGRLAALILYSKEEKPAVASRLANGPRCLPESANGECTFSRHGAANGAELACDVNSAGASCLDNGAAYLLDDRKAYGKAGSVLTVVSHRSIQAGLQRMGR
jgi:hypothetical protein